VIELIGLTPAAEEGWWTLFDLAEANSADWLLVGGQMMFLLAVENDSSLPRATDDVDVVVNVRTMPAGTEWLSVWLLAHSFHLDGVSPDGFGHRFYRDAQPGPGRVVFDVLAPEGLGERTPVFTRRPARTVQAPGSLQAFERSEVVDVAVTGMLQRGRREGRVRRPNLLGALVMKAATTTLAVRANRARDWQDAALLLSLLPDPIATAAQCGSKDGQRLGKLAPLNDRAHQGWATMSDEDYRRGTAALAFLLDAPAR
jgi:hypothetical protein